MTGRGSYTAMPQSTTSAVDATPAPETTDAQKELVKGPMRSEVKHLDYKSSDKGEHFYVETKDDEEVPEQQNWWEMYALCIVRTFNSCKWVQRTDLRINSPHLKAILNETIDVYPGISFSTKNITIPAPYQVLYHYRLELMDKLETLETDSDAAKHLALLLDFIHDHFKETIEEADNLRQQNLITYELAWTILRPGVTVCAVATELPAAYTLQRYEYENHGSPRIILSVEYTDFDGKHFGTRSKELFIPYFNGTCPVLALPAMPISYHPDEAAFRATLIERGRRFEKLAGMHFQHYQGIATFGKDRISHDGRIVIDTKTFLRKNPDLAFHVRSFSSEPSDQDYSDDCSDLDFLDDEPPRRSTLQTEQNDEKESERTPLTDDQCLRATAIVRGFSFVEKTWYQFHVDGLKDIDWNPHCFNQLVIPDVQKDTVRALVSTHIENSVEFDDIVRGKGQGLVLLLHGPPGVGKTLTAETVAEYCKRPLYSVSSGDLGTNSESLDQRLQEILDLASTWKAVLLIDEADVFLERRSLYDIERNALVSIFLRVLEWYKGILFLTTNRVSSFDDAFKSRIHVPLKYTDLTPDSRKQVWKTFLSGVTITEEQYAQLAEAKLNGRQIKNIVRTAKSLGQYHGEKLDVAKLLQVLEIQNSFAQDLASGMVFNSANE